MQWTLIPKQFGGLPHVLKKKGNILNARAESLFEKQAFKNNNRQRRYIIPLEGFYDFQHRMNGKKKITQLHYIEKDNGPTFCAGVWDEYCGLRSFAIMTTEANTLMTVIHNNNPRQPHIIDPDGWERWLSPKVDDDGIKRMLEVYPDDKLIATEYHINIAIEPEDDTNNC